MLSVYSVRSKLHHEVKARVFSVVSQAESPFLRLEVFLNESHHDLLNDDLKKDRVVEDVGDDSVSVRSKVTTKDGKMLVWCGTLSRTFPPYSCCHVLLCSSLPLRWTPPRDT